MVMDDSGLKSKILEWLRLKEEASSLQKASDVYEGQLTPEKGVSDRGIEARRADPKVQGIIAHGYGRTAKPEKHKERAKKQFKTILERVKAQPKPNLPKSEAIPADVSEPVIQNRVDNNGPKMIQQPNEVNPYRQIFDHLRSSKVVKSEDGWKEVKNGVHVLTHGGKKIGEVRNYTYGVHSFLGESKEHTGKHKSIAEGKAAIESAHNTQIKN
jgi:hypothetical protein